MVKMTKPLRLMGTSISVTEKYEGMFESQKIFIEKNKHLFKYRGGGQSSIVVENLPRRSIGHHPQLKFPSKVAHIIRSARATNLAFLMAKYLEESDVNKYQNRLYVPKHDMAMHLSDGEKARVEKQGREGGLDVAVIDPRGITLNLNMKMWLGSGNSSKYVLIREWAKLVRDNGLKKDDLVELWCFRANSKLTLAINVSKKVVEPELWLGLGSAVSS